MRPPAEILSMLIASGLNPQQVALVAEYGLASVAAVNEPRAAAETTLDRKRQADRERLREKRAAERQSRDNGDSRAMSRDTCDNLRQSRDMSQAEDAPAPTRTRGLDKPLTVVVSGTDGGDGGGAHAREIKPSSDDWPDGDAKTHADQLVSLAASPWLDPQRSPSLVTTTGRVNAWRKSGASWLHDVVPVIQGTCQRQRQRINGWQFFDQAIARSMADNLRALEIPEAGSRATGPPRQTLAAQIGAEVSAATELALSRIKARANG